jgi:DHA1 family tetracycline resistance protein-like MFS transporter
VTAPTGAPRRARRLEPWFIPFALVNGAAVGLSPILLPLVAAGQGAGHVGLVMGAFNLGAFAAPVAGALADRYRAYRAIAVACAALSAVSLWLFPLASSSAQLLLALADGGGFAGAVTIANLLIVERRPQSEWNQRLGWLETVLSVGQGGALVLAAWLTGLGPRSGLLIAALVPAAAIPLALVLIPRGPRAAAAGPACRADGPASGAPGPPQAVPAAGEQRTARATHRLADVGRVGEWGPASPSRVHHLHQRRRPLAGLRRSAGLVRGRFGWLLAAWIPAYAGSAIVFSLYPVLFQHAFGVAPRTSALAFAIIVFVSLPIFALAGRISQRRGPAAALAGALGARVILLGVLAALAAAGQVPVVLPLAAFSGVLFAWSFLSVASPGLTGLLVPQAEGEAQGILAASSGAAGFAGSVAGGLAAAHWGYPAALGIGAGATAAGLIIFSTTMLRPARQPRRLAG